MSLEEVPSPEPGRGQVLVKMRAWSLNYRDLLVVLGSYAPKLKLPFQILSDGVGEVAAVGRACYASQGWRSRSRHFHAEMDRRRTDARRNRQARSGGAIPGLAGRARRCSMANGSVPRSERISPTRRPRRFLAPRSRPGNALVDVAGSLRPARRFSSRAPAAFRSSPLQFARMVGARVIATSSSDAKLERVRRLGRVGRSSTTRRPRVGHAAARELTGARRRSRGRGRRRRNARQSFEAVRIGAGSA